MDYINVKNKTAKRSQTQPYDREYIVYLIRSRTGRSLRKNSEQCGYHPTSFAQALGKPWPDVQELIARLIGEDPWVIWPDRYDDNHQPIRKRAPRQKRRG